MKKFVIPKKKFTMPKVTSEARALPEVLAMLAFLQQEVNAANATLEQVHRLDKEIARIKKNKKSAPRNP